MEEEKTTTKGATTGATIGTIVVIVFLVVAGFLIFDNGDGDLARDGENATTTEDFDFTGTGGAEEGFDPLEGEFIDDGIDGDGIPDKG